MTTLPLRDLLRQPSKVKRLTRAGHTVRITDHGVPLWDLQPVKLAEQDPSDVELRRAVEDIFVELLAEKPLPNHSGSVPISEVVIKSRR